MIIIVDHYLLPILRIEVDEWAVIHGKLLHDLRIHLSVSGHGQLAVGLSQVADQRRFLVGVDAPATCDLAEESPVHDQVERPSWNVLTAIPVTLRCQRTCVMNVNHKSHTLFFIVLSELLPMADMMAGNSRSDWD